MRSGLHFPPKDEPLREDVRRLGALVGETLREQGGDELFDRVEAARRGAIDRREAAGEQPLFDEALPVGEAADLIRAFSLYFQIINLAEKTHRVRRRREYQKTPDTPQRGSFHDLTRRLAGDGVSLEEVSELLSQLSIEPVFTAHPTEATRRAILEKQQQIARRLTELFDFSATPPELRINAARIRSEVTGIWQTEAQPPTRPTVLGELEHVLYYLMDVIYRMVPYLYEEMEDALADAYGEAARSTSVPIFLRFASWVGGDMDGNPNVTAETLRAALARHRDALLERYGTELRRHARSLTQTTSRVGFDPRVLELNDRYGEQFPEVIAAISPRESDMPYRLLFRLLAARVEATAAGEARGYSGPDTLLDDLRVAAASLEANAAEHGGLFALRRTLRRVATFGFHLAGLDVRQDSLVHREVIASLLDDPQWLERPAAERAATLVSKLAGEIEPIEGTDEVRATLDVFRAIRDAKKTLGTGAIGPYIISMAQGADDVLSVLYLARRAGLDSSALDVAPLFETVDDLQSAAATMRTLFADELYREHLSTRGDRQMVMVGYSDSNKDGGLTASRWALYEAQEELVEAFEEAGVGLTIFHGRGGTISRGGGKTHRAVLAAPSGSVAGRLRATEQGEVIDDNYSLRPIAARTFERAVGAVLLASLKPHDRLASESRWREIATVIAQTSRTTYRDLVFAEGFDRYFRTATPVDVIERMEIGSRPASRRKGGGIENLRAIPWVFSWTQSRHVLPGWYGLGTGLAEAIDRFGVDGLREMLVDWPFFAVLLDDAEMVLGKADMAIARRYAELAGDEGTETFARIETEFERTVEHILSIKENEGLLDDDPVLQRAIRLRNPYIDPMSELQIDLLCLWRESERRDDELLEALRASVRGISYGLQNTG